MRVDGFIYPGLIDLHSHLAYNFLPLWSAPRDEPYDNRYTWANPDDDVRPRRGRPAEAMGIAAAAAALRYAEVKAVVGGVTAIQGSPPTTRPFPGLDGPQHREGEVRDAAGGRRRSSSR